MGQESKTKVEMEFLGASPGTLFWRGRNTHDDPDSPQAAFLEAQSADA
jgi:hypothetical protein